MRAYVCAHHEWCDVFSIINPGVRAAWKKGQAIKRREGVRVRWRSQCGRVWWREQGEGQERASNLFCAEIMIYYEQIHSSPVCDADAARCEEISSLADQSLGDTSCDQWIKIQNCADIQSQRVEFKAPFCPSESSAPIEEGKPIKCDRLPDPWTYLCDGETEIC